MRTDNPFTVGDVVKFADPMPDEDGTERMVVIEARGDRTLVTPASGFESWQIKPQMSYFTRELCKA